MATQKSKPDHLEVVGTTRKKTAHLPKLLMYIQQMANENINRLLEHMFSASDDLFYDLSKRATSNNEQNLYFESMREIRIKKSGLINSFGHKLNERFEDLCSDQAKPAERKEDNNSALSIVESDALEVELALNNMTSRAREANKEALYELSIRLDHLQLKVAVDEDNNPLDPQQMSALFVETCAKNLQVNIKARLILFKLFEKHVLKQLGHAYSDANQLLIEAGILPKVPKNLNKNPNGSYSASHGSDQTEQGGTHLAHSAQSPINQLMPAPTSFSLDIRSLANLMASARTQQGNLFSTPSNQSNAPYAYYLYSSNPGPIMDSPQLASLLTKSQPIVDRQLCSKEPRNIVADVVNKLLAKRDPQAPQSVEQPDEDIINLIAMFFDKILEDDQLPVAIQSLICRLQIPLLKVALRDQSFLLNPEHPARKLVNIITEAGLGLDEQKSLERDPLYRKIADGVQTINRLYKADDSVFIQIHAEIEELLTRERRKTNIVERRTNQAEAGKSKIKHARASSQNAIYDKLKSTKLPEVISSFLTNTWLQVLVITHLKQGHESAEWVEMENVIVDLIWLCQDHTDERSQLRRRRLLPEVLQRIEQGLEAAIDNPGTRAAKVNAVEEALEELASQNIEEETFVELSDDQKAALGKADPDQKNWDEMTALERQQTKYEELSNKFYLDARNTPEGVWVDYFDDSTGRMVRCKLSAKIDPETYIFVNRLGLKTLEKSRRQFAYDMQFNRAKVLDEEPIFERIMSKVVSHLKQAA